MEFRVLGPMEVLDGGRRLDLGPRMPQAGVDAELALDLVELALLMGVVVENAQSPGRFRFSNALVRDTLYDDLSSLRRARLHRRAGEALERLHPGAPPLSDLAHHYLAGVAAGTVDKAITYAVALASQASAGFAFELAEHQLDQALALLSSTPPSEARSERELDVRIRLCSVLGIRRGFADPEVGEALRRAGELSRQVGDSARLLGSLRGAFFFALVGSDLDKAEEIGRQFLELSQEGADHPFVAAAHRAAGTVAFCRGRLVEARHELERALALADMLDDSSSTSVMNNRTVGMRNTLALALWLLGDVEASDRVSTEALSLARGCGVMVLVDALFLAGVRHALGGDAPATLECAEEGLGLATKHGIRLYDGATKILRGWARAAQTVPTPGWRRWAPHWRPSRRRARECSAPSSSASWPTPSRGPAATTRPWPPSTPGWPRSRPAASASGRPSCTGSAASSWLEARIRGATPRRRCVGRSRWPRHRGPWSSGPGRPRASPGSRVAVATLPRLERSPRARTSLGTT